MILYNNTMVKNKRKRDIRTLSISIEERPERPVYVFKNKKARIKFIRKTEITIRKSTEYKEYIKFLKNNMDMNRCAVLRGLNMENGRRYSIEIHHSPFTLFDIVDTVLTKRESLGEPINPLLIADEVMELHYNEKIGLIPLSKTMHELVHNDKIFVPLQYIYHKYDEFYDEYEDFISQNIKDKIELMVTLSLKSKDILSDVLDTEFVYVEVDGFSFPEVPPEWQNLISINNDAILNDTKKQEGDKPI